VRIWIYEAQIVRHVDGDTTVMDIDQGMNQWAHNQYVRYAGINAPEISGPEKPQGDEAKAYLESLLAVGQQVWLATIEYHEFEKYGRVLAVIYTDEPKNISGTLIDLLPGSINEEMVDTGHAVPYFPEGNV
jgi:endonuclease YncB( thermonuclease family)